MAGRFALPPPPIGFRNFSAPSVWLEFSPLASLTSSLNLGQGFPTFPPPPFVTAALSRCASEPALSKYARSRGHPRLVSAIQKRYGVSEREVVVTVGASEALFLSVLATVDKGMEVVLVEPAFDIYRGAVEMCGGICRYVGLKWRESGREKGLSGLKLDLEELDNVLSDNTRLLVLNSPHNPTGKVFTREEYEGVAKVLDRYPKVVVLSDEVYEALVYEPFVHVPFASVSPSAAERTISVYSAGKMFSITGWKIGWAIAPEPIARRLAIAQQYLVFSVATPLQESVAIALETAEKPYEGFASYFEFLRTAYTKKKDILMQALQAAKLNPIEPQGAFYIVADVSKILPRRGLLKPPVEIERWVKEGKLEIDERTTGRKDYNVAREMSLTWGITGIPPSAFYDAENTRLGEGAKSADDLSEGYIRLAFCKTDEELKEAAKRIVRASIEPHTARPSSAQKAK